MTDPMDAPAAQAASAAQPDPAAQAAPAAQPDLTPLHVLVRIYVEGNVTIRAEDDGVGFNEYQGIVGFDSDPYYSVKFTGEKAETFVWTERVAAAHMKDMDEFVEYAEAWEDEVVIQAPDDSNAAFPVSIQPGSLRVVQKVVDPSEHDSDHFFVTFSATITVQVKD